MNNDGKDYERFVATLQQALLDAEHITKQKNIKVKLNKKIVDSCGVKREFDLYWEYEFGGITYKTVIECKDYKSAISLEKIDAIIGKIKDIPDLKPVFATKTGYQSGARTKAEGNGIDLLIVREQNDSDWEDVDGNPLIKEIHVDLLVQMPATITGLEPLLDAEWVEENMNEAIDTSVKLLEPNNEIFIENKDNGERYSIYELGYKLAPLEGKEYGSFTKEERFNSGWFEGPDFKYKIKGYNLSYTIPQPYKESMEYDYSKGLIGVIEYLDIGKKKLIFKENIIKENPIPDR